MPKLSESVHFSDAAIALFRLHIERHGQVEVDDATRPIYRELARAGVMIAGNTFAEGEESIYHVTKAGFERKAELLSWAKEAV